MIMRNMLARFRVLDRKLLRDIWRMRGQVLALGTIVMCGVGLFITMHGTLRSLDETRTAYYERYRFAEIFAPAKRAPAFVLDRIRDVAGVAAVEGRVEGAITVDMAGVPEPIQGRILSLPENREPRVNHIFLKFGRLPTIDSGDEIVLANDFAVAHSLMPGDTLSAVIYGTRQTLSIVGVALAPEFVYVIPPGGLSPDARRYAVMWMGEEGVANAFNMKGAVNSVLALVSRGARKEAVISAIDDILAPFGGTGAYSRDDHLSDEFLRSELDQLKTMGRLLPPIFLAVAAFLLNIVMTRMVEQERQQIGLLKAFGYRPVDVTLHYTKFALVVAILGIAAGWGLGAWLGRGLAELYVEYYQFPLLLFEAGAENYAISALVAITAALLGVLTAVRRVMHLRPAVAMAPPAPTRYGAKLSALGGRRKWFDQSSRLILRHLLRWPMRAGLSCLGIALAMALYVGIQSIQDSVKYMMDVSFHVVARQDMSVYFAEPQERTILHEVVRLPGVETAEPVRAVPARLIHGHRRYRQGITGLTSGTQLSRIVDEDLHPVTVPRQGVVLSRQLAQILNAFTGDMIRAEIMEGERPTIELRVTAVVPTLLGTSAYMEIGALNRALSEVGRVSGADLTIDETQSAELYRLLKDMPQVAAVMLQREAERTMQETLDESMGSMIFINAMFAALIAVGVVYNCARVSFLERSWEMASLRVLGFSQREVALLFLGELILITFAALPIGVAMGAGLSWFLGVNMSSELFRLPFALSRETVGSGVTIILGAAALSGAFVYRNLTKLDLVSALKVRE